MFNYSIGGQERKLDIANEAIADIPINRTLLIEKLTNDPPLGPTIVHDLKTVEEVFAHYKPAVEVDFSDEDGADVFEELQFRNLGDFTKKGIINQSPFLQNLNNQADDLQKLMRQLKSNKIFQKALANPDAKVAFLAAIDAMISEIE
jgi:predicted component of type VI protein secretion system